MSVYVLTVMRPMWFYRQVEGFDNLQDMAYIAYVEADDPILAGKAARLQAMNADKKLIVDFLRQRGQIITKDDPYLQERCSEDYTVLNHVFQGTLIPWLNGKYI